MRVFAGILFLLCTGALTAQRSLLDSLKMEQCILVVIDNDASTQGELYFFARTSPCGTGRSCWSPKLEKIPVTIGKNGAAWGKGLHPGGWNKDELKKEGDGKSPKGLYDVGAVFGYGGPDTSIHRIYLRSDTSCYCVDDAASRYYNRIVDTKYITKDWKSAEPMRRNDELYKWGLEIGYNQGPVQKGAGSCIFFHIWRAAGKPTAGCTAMEEKNLLNILHRLQYRQVCGYILLTRAEFEQHKKTIGLDAARL